MPVVLSGTTFYTLTEVVHVAGVTRQTLWRWRKARQVPSGQSFPGRHVLFTVDEAEAVYRYARRVAPTRLPDPEQLPLFMTSPR
ncbi:MAG: hypothetical protein AAGI71_17215 [Bacteroidota bacterium]